MKKDYAKRVYVNERKKSPSPKWVFLFVAIFLLMGIVLYVEHSTQTSFLVRMKTWFKPHSTLPVTVKKEEPQEPEVQFSFYNALPKMKIEVLKLAETGQSQTEEKVVKDERSEKEKTGYFLQFGIFKEASRASQVRVSLLLAGIETEIEKEQVSEETTFRVQQGPFTTLSEAKTYQKKWQKKGIDSVIKN